MARAPDPSPQIPQPHVAMAWRDTVLGLTLAESLQRMIDEHALSTAQASEIIRVFDQARSCAARVHCARLRALVRCGAIPLSSRFMSTTYRSRRRSLTLST